VTATFAVDVPPCRVTKRQLPDAAGANAKKAPAVPAVRGGHVLHEAEPDDDARDAGRNRNSRACAPDAVPVR
jgi:hypothetical protein